MRADLVFSILVGLAVVAALVLVVDGWCTKQLHSKRQSTYVQRLQSVRSVTGLRSLI